MSLLPSMHNGLRESHVSLSRPGITVWEMLSWFPFHRTLFAGPAEYTLFRKPLPQVDHIIHSPAVPKTSEKVTITARVQSVNLFSKVEVIYRADNNNANGTWESLEMKDNGQAPDLHADDGLFAVEINKYRSDHQVVQFYVRATDDNPGFIRTPSKVKPGPQCISTTMTPFC